MVTLSIKRKPETNEWKVVWVEDGKYSEAKTYYTDDPEDAVGTLRWLLTDYAAKGVDVEVSEGKETSRLMEKY